MRHLTGLLDDCRPQEIALGPKAAIDGPGRETGLTDDVHDLRPVVALSGEDTGRGSEQALADGVFSTARGRISLRDEIDVHGVENKVYSGLGQGSHHQSRMISVDGTVHEPNWLRYTERLARFCRRWRFDAAGLGPPDRLPVNAQKPRAGRRRNCANDDAPRERTTPSASKLRRSRGLDESGFGRGLVYGRLPYRSSRAHRQEARDTDTDTGGDGPAQSVHPRGTAVRGHLRRRRSSQHLPNDLENTLGGETGERSQAEGDSLPAVFLDERHIDFTAPTPPYLHVRGETGRPRNTPSRLSRSTSGKTPLVEMSIRQSSGMDKESFIDALNEDLRTEYQSIVLNTSR